MLVLVTLALAQAPPTHIKNFPPRHQVQALAIREDKIVPPAADPQPQAETPAPVVETPEPAPAPVGYSGSGDPNLDYIIAHESSGNPYAINYLGACGLFQALPCSKLGCDLSDIQCQIDWGRSYAINRYGSTYQAMLFWQANRWW